MDIRNDTRIITRFNKKVDRSGPCHIWMGGINGTGYGNFHLSGRIQSAHRVAYALAYGPFDPKMQVDHTCHNRACQNPQHLRLVTNKQNRENHQGPQSDNASGVRGVTWRKAARKWHVQVCHYGEMHDGGLYHSIDDAEAAVIELRKSLHTHNDNDRR